jgi:hypothetical protein
MRIGVEVGIDEIRNLAGMPVQLDQVGAVDLAQVRPGAPLVNPQQRIERVECTAMDIKRIRQQLADRRLPARFVDRLGTPSPKEQVVGLAAGLGTSITIA